MMRIYLVLAVFFFIKPALATKGVELQKNKGFVGYVEAGTTIEIKTVSVESQTLQFVDPKNLDVGTLQVSFKSFERALGGNKKVEYLHKVEPLTGRSFTLKNNLVLKAL